MGNGLDEIAPPPKKVSPPPQTTAPASKPVATAASTSTKRKPKSRPPVKFDKEAETAKVQFNKRIPRRAADAFEMLAIKTRRKVPELLEEAAEMLEQKYGKV